MGQTERCLSSTMVENSKNHMKLILILKNNIRISLEILLLTKLLPSLNYMKPLPIAFFILSVIDY